MSRKMKNCPFCNGPGEVQIAPCAEIFAYVECTVCGATGPVYKEEPINDTTYADKAIRAWDKREFD